MQALEKPNSGMVKPNMGISIRPTESNALADALFPKVRQRILAVLFGAPDRSFYANEVIALAASGTGTVQQPKIWLIGSAEQVHAPSA